jgi:multiple sugar transport system ATP-binding protein
MANIKLQNIKKVYEKNVTAVQDFSLEIADKEFVVLVGPSGCGKSTTLRMIAGLEEITEGELYIGDRLVNDVAPKDRDIAMVFQSYALYPHMTVYENLAFALKLRHMKKDIVKEKVFRAAETLEITELLQRKPKALSGGQRQRVAIGRAIVREPQVFLMDEPLSNLDAKLRNQMRSELIKLRQTVDTTFVYVTHDQTEAMTLGDRIVVMNEGHIQQIGTPQEVFNEPANLFVAGFIGSPQMNFISARLELAEDRYVVRAYGAETELPAPLQKKLKSEKMQPCDVRLGIRPEHIKICAPGKPDAIKAMLDVSEMMGSEMHLHVKIGEDEIVIRTATSDFLQDYTFEHNQESLIYFTFPGAMIHLFDNETQMNMMKG